MKIHGSKGIIDLDDIEPGDIELKDIAGSLSRQARFNGNGKGKISVAQHCIVGATAIAGGTGNYPAALWFLLHDAHEAYTGDIITPMKQRIISTALSSSDPIGDLQDKLDDAISRKLFFDFDFHAVKTTDWYQSVKDLDKFLAKYEAARLFPYVERPTNTVGLCSEPVSQIAACIYNGGDISGAITTGRFIPSHVKDLPWRQKADLVLRHPALRKNSILFLEEKEVETLYINLYQALYAAAAIRMTEQS